MESNTGITEDIITKFLSTFQNISPGWLLTGEGAMFKDCNTKTPILEEKKLIPLYDDVIGMSQSHHNPHENELTTKWINTGDWFPEATAAIRHYGDSMTEYSTGSILALKKVEDIHLLTWGCSYCIETNEFRIIRRIQSGTDNTIVAYASNTKTHPDGRQIYEPQVISLINIRHVWSVLGCVTKEYGNEKNMGS